MIRLKIFLLTTSLLLLSFNSWSAGYMGFNYGQDFFSSPTLEDYKVHPKGSSYGGFLGYGKDFLGFEIFYQSLNAKGDINHDAATYDLITNAQAFGGALRLSMELLYFRAGAVYYKIDQSVDIPNAASQSAAETIYDIETNDVPKTGYMYGAGFHHKISGIRVFIDYTKYEIGSVGSYNTFSAGFSFAIPDALFKMGKF